MFKKISASIQYPHWVSQCPRFRRLDLLDKLLDGRFYDHLPYAFFDETDTTGGPIPLEKRRPSAQWKFANQVASYCSRKLFAGNHAPRVMHKDDATRKLILRLLRKAKWMTTMLEAAKLGSVGSIAVTFRVERRDDGTLHIGTNCWRSKYCDPSFDTMGELTSLRLQYVTTGAWLDALGAPPPRDGEKIDRGGKYWFIRDYGQMNEVTYRPVKEADWNPIDGFLGEPTRQLLPWTVIEHGLGFVPGHWFKNLVGGCEPDGDCTFEPGVDNSIEHDYTLSQIGRGIRYNAAPTLVVKGNITNAKEDGSITRGPTMMIQLPPDIKSADGDVYISGGEAKLLEMSGAGTEAGLKYVDRLQELALESVAANRKDPATMKGPMSGRAMEFIDQEYYDLVMELRTQYGELGALVLARKIVQAVDPAIDLSSFTLVWPRLFQPTPTDLAQVIPALAIAIDPLKAGPAMPEEPGGTDANGGAQPGKPATTGPDPAMMLLTPDQARAWLESNMDMRIINDDDPDPEEPEEERPGEAPEQTPAPEDISDPGGTNLDGSPRATTLTLDV